MNDKQQQNTIDGWLLNFQACPMDASVNWNPSDDKKEERIEWYEYYNLLPLSIRWGLSSEEIVKQILSLAKKYDIYDECKIGEVSRIIREYFFKPPTKQQLTDRIKQRLEITNEKLDKFIHDLNDIIFEVERIGKERVAEVTETMPIIPALKRFPLLRNQVITKNNIKLFETKEFVTPSVGNWIDDYIQRKGAQAHNNIQRSDYIFNSENGMKLDSEDQKKLGVLFESYDNDNNLHINSESQEIMFSGGFEPDKEKEKPAIQEPEMIEEQQGPAQGPQGQPIEVEIKQQEVPGPPQPQVDVMPEKDAMLQDWKSQNLQSMNSEAAVSEKEKDQQPTPPDQNSQIDREKKLLPHERTQEIGWFGESTGIDEVKRQISNRQDEESQIAQPKDKKEAKYGHPRTITRNYREVKNAPKKGSKHVINLKEVA